MKALTTILTSNGMAIQLEQDADRQGLAKTINLVSHRREVVNVRSLSRLLEAKRAVLIDGDMVQHMLAKGYLEPGIDQGHRTLLQQERKRMFRVAQGFRA